LIHQLRYNLFERGIESSLIDVLEDHAMGAVVFARSLKVFFRIVASRASRRIRVRATIPGFSNRPRSQRTARLHQQAQRHR
jgi:aryl-alcohol dehydrogenase-like predicted oxidoreductase